MKRFIYIVCFLLLSIFSNAQPPTKNNSNAIHLEERSIQKKESTSESQSIDQHENENQHKIIQQQTITKAKWNEFVDLYNIATTSPLQKNPTSAQESALNKSYVGLNAEKQYNSFEYNLATFMKSNYNIANKNFLDEAKRIQPKNKLMLLQSVGLYFILNNDKIVYQDLIELNKQNQWNSDDYDYARDVLESVSENGVIITHGINDSYPMLYVQNIENKRKDVTVIPLHLLQSLEFRTTLIKKGFTLTSEKSVLINPDFIQKFCKENESKKIQLALTFPTNYFTNMSEALFPIGLTYQYSTNSLQNGNLNDKLWSNNLDKSAITKAKGVTGKELSANYIPMLYNLYQYYKAKDETKKQLDIRKNIIRIGENINHTNLINELGL